MTIKEFLNQLTVGGVAGWAIGAVFLLLSIIQISPLKLNPWDNILGWFGKKINGQTREEMTELRKQVKDLWINDHRHAILTFARECRGGIDHNAEEWNYLLNVCEEYEAFCEKNDVVNGVVRQNTRYIRELYQELSREHRI